MLATSVFVNVERETYLVAPEARNALIAGVKAMLLVTAVTQRGQPLIWPIALGDSTGRRNAWHETAREAAEKAKRNGLKSCRTCPAVAIEFSGLWAIFPIRHGPINLWRNCCVSLFGTGSSMTRIIRRSGKLWGLSRNPGAIARWPRHRFENCGVSILSFVVTRAKPLGLCAWSPASSIAVKKFSCDATNCSHLGKPLSTLAPTRHSSPITARPSWGAFWNSVGRCPPTSLICSRNIELKLMAENRSAGMACSEPSLFAGWPILTLARKRQCGVSYVISGNGRRQNRTRFLEYCASDVAGVTALLPIMAPSIDWPRAKLRGRFMAAAARMERIGIPIDAPLHQRLVANWEPIKRHLIADVDLAYGVFEETSFKRDRFAQYLCANDIPWPRLPSGELALDDTTFDEQARAHPSLRSLYELRATLGRLRLADLPVGADQRARCLLSAFQAVTAATNLPAVGSYLVRPGGCAALLGSKRGERLPALRQVTARLAAQKRGRPEIIQSAQNSVEARRDAIAAYAVSATSPLHAP